MASKIQTMPEAELRQHAMKLNVLLGKMKQKSDADKLNLTNRIKELEEQQTVKRTDSDSVQDQIESLNLELKKYVSDIDKYKSDIQKLDQEKNELDSRKNLEIHGLTEKLNLMEEERVREKEILWLGLKNESRHLFNLWIRKYFFSF